MNQKGFTLLEVMIAIAVASIVLVGIAGTISQMHKNTATITQKMAADLAARNLMDRYRLRLPKGTNPLPQNESGNVEMGGYDFTYRQTLVPAAQPELKRVDITVSSPDGRTDLRTLSMYVAVNS